MEADLLSSIKVKRSTTSRSTDKYTLTVQGTDNIGYRQVTYVVLLVVGNPRLERSNLKKSQQHFVRHNFFRVGRQGHRREVALLWLIIN